MSDLTPRQSEAVRRALRAARHDAPVPDEVAARLDDRLAELVAERTSPVETTVVPLRRRRLPAVLAAAAAVTAVGLASTQLMERGAQTDSMHSAESAGDAVDEDLPPVAGAESHAYDGADTFRNDVGTTSTLVPALTATDLDRLTDEGYRRVRALPPLDENSALVDGRNQSPKELNRDLRTSPKASGPWAAAAPAAPCAADIPGDVLDETALYRARHEGRPVVLVVLPGPEVTAYPCGGGDPTAVPLD